MTVDIHPDCKKRLNYLLGVALPKLRVKNGIFIVREGAYAVLYEAEQALPTKGRVRDQLVSYVDDYPFIEFVLDFLAQEIRDFKYIAGEELIGLSSLPGYADSQMVAARLVDEFIALPRQYRMTIKLPPELNAILKSDEWIIEIGPHLRLLRGGTKMEELCPLSSDDQKLRERLAGSLSLMMLLDTAANWEENALYLQIDATGFIGPYGGTAPHLDALRIVRTFLGLGIALRLFEVAPGYVAATPPGPSYIHQQDGDKWIGLHRLTLDDSLSRSINVLRLNTLEGRIDNNEKQLHWARTVFDQMRIVFNAGKKADSISLASQWFFDGSNGYDELLKYVQCMVVLEIILGDKASSDQMGLNELLRNRCAYLIGNSQEERAEVHDAFKKIYDVRSQIVHRGKHRLSSEERQLSSRLKWMCRRVIQKEVELLRANKDIASALALV